MKDKEKETGNKETKTVEKAVIKDENKAEKVIAWWTSVVISH